MVTGPNEIAWMERPDRTPGSGEVRVQNRFGTEKHGTLQAIIKAYGNRRGQMNEKLGIYFGDGVAWNYPLPLGNMNYGTVVELGPDVDASVLGQTVAVSGPFQPFTTTALAECFTVPDGMDWKTTFLQDPGEFALGALRDGNVRYGDRVAVFSLGAIGLTTVQMAKAAGASCVIGIDPLPNRRAAGLAGGADAVLGENPDDLGWQIRQIARREGIDVVIDFSGHPSVMGAAFRALGPLGTLVLGAYPNATTAEIDFGRESHHNQLNIVFTRACSHPLRDHPRWDWHRIRREVWQGMCRGSLNGAPIVDEPVPFDSLLEAYPDAMAHPERSIKLSVTYP